jgi:hypothetical protein
LGSATIRKGGIVVFCAGCAVTAIIATPAAFAATFTTCFTRLAFFTRGIRARGVIARRSGHRGLVGQCEFFLGSIAWRAVALCTAVAALTTWTLTATLAFTAWLLLTAAFSAAFARCALRAGLGTAFAAGFTLGFLAGVFVTTGEAREAEQDAAARVSLSNAREFQSVVRAGQAEEAAGSPRSARGPLSLHVHLFLCLYQMSV